MTAGRNRAGGAVGIGVGGIAVRIGRRRRGLLRLHRPARLIANIAGRPQIVGETKRAVAFTERGHLERILRAAGAGAGNRLDPHNFEAFLHRTGFQACDFGLGPPRLPLGGLEKPAPAACQRYKDEGADEIQTNSTRHPRTLGEFI
jgi:hypothetical protein